MGWLANVSANGSVSKALVDWGAQCDNNDLGNKSIQASYCVLGW